MTDKFFEFVLFFFNFGFLAPLIIFGIHFIHKKVFINAALIAFLSAFVNTFLKDLWRVPLHHSVKVESWAFPSGHTQLNVTLWLAILFYIRKPWLIVTVIIMHLLDFLGMLHFNYHNWWDILGGIFFAFIVFLILPTWQYFWKNKQLEFAIFCFAFSVILFLQLPYKVTNYQWLYVYFGLYTGFIVYLTLSKFKLDYVQASSLKMNILKAILLIGFMFMINELNFSTLFNCGRDEAAFIKGVALPLSTLIIIPLIISSFQKYFKN